MFSTPGNYLEITWKLPGNYLEITWKLPRNYLEITWKLPGKVLEFCCEPKGKNPVSKHWESLVSRLKTQTMLTKVKESTLFQYHEEFRKIKSTHGYWSKCASAQELYILFGLRAQDSIELWETRAHCSLITTVHRESTKLMFQGLALHQCMFGQIVKAQSISFVLFYGHSESNFSTWVDELFNIKSSSLFLKLHIISNSTVLFCLSLLSYSST